MINIGELDTDPEHVTPKGSWCTSETETNSLAWIPFSENNLPTGCQGVAAVEAREMQDTLGVEVVHILPVVDSAREQVEQDLSIK